MSEEFLNDLVYSKNVIEFVTVANEYCSFVENSLNYSRFDFINKAHMMFPLLYLKACLLPEIDEETAETPEKYVNEVDYNFLLNKISGKLGRYDAYQEVFDEAIQFSETAIEANVSENICDIYQDLKDFLMVYRIGTIEIMSDALWECKNNFNTFWGQKLVNGLRALHAIRYGEFDVEEDAVDVKKQKPEVDKESWVSKHFNNYFEGEETGENDL
ncbi:MAG: DUF5063 domain-containing protein [Prolixibacteraceae bacterium]